MIQIFDDNSLILTVNARLSNYLCRKYDEIQIHAGKATWHTLKCLPLNRWILETVRDLPDTNIILNDAQEFALWENIISQTNHPNIIYQSWKIAETAQQAWRILKQWRMPIAAISEYFSEDARLFFKWATIFATICQKQQWLTESDCVNVLVEALQTPAINLPTKIIIAGFDEFTPEIQHLINILNKHCQIEFYENKIKPLSITRTQYSNEDEELRHMAYWAKNILKDTPFASIACVVPHLSSIRNKIVHVFTEIFATNNATSLLNDTLSFNISAGCSFHEYPLIHAAFQILSLDTKETELTKISALLRSPFIGDAQKESIKRAQLNFLLHETQERALTLFTVINIGKKNASASLLATHLQNFIRHLPSIHEARHLNIWAKKITTLLNMIGWPGERNLNSDEYQQLQRWQKLLIEFTQLETVYHQPIYFHQAVNYLKILAQKTLFQSETQPTSLQILGALEIAGMTFDHLWVMGMNDDKWPQSASPNPFIPTNLQRKYNMPHASAEREFLFAKTVTERLCQSAKYINFSYSQQKDDTPLRMSKLIQNLADIKGASSCNIADFLKLSVQLETIIDNIAPPVSPYEKTRGGASILKDQAACPFRAFAKYRLGAKKTPIPSSGLSPQESGNLVHEILEDIWRTLQNQEVLKSYEEHMLNDLINKSVSTALKKKSQYFPFTLKKKFITLESQRLFKLIKSWLAIEKNRPFFTVVSQETAKQINFHGLTMRLRIDREDQLLNGKHIIIDYKTGKTRIESWFGDRPDDPQLPLYCLSSDHKIDGILFAELRSAAPHFKGITAEDFKIDGVKAINQQKIASNINNWQDFKMVQTETLVKIAHDFQIGKSDVDPKHPHETCQYCQLHGFCRIYNPRN